MMQNPCDRILGILTNSGGKMDRRAEEVHLLGSGKLRPSDRSSMSFLMTAIMS